MQLINFIFTRTFFLIASYQISQNDTILINYESFFQVKEYSQLYRFQFLEINSIMAATIKNKFSKQNSYEQIAEFGNNLFISKHRKRLSCRESFA